MKEQVRLASAGWVKREQRQAFANDCRVSANKKTGNEEKRGE